MLSLLVPVFALLKSRSICSLDIGGARQAMTCLERTLSVEDHGILNDICNSNGIECNEGVVWKISWFHCEIQIYSMDWLPPTLRKVQLAGHRGKKFLNTRNLPRAMTFCWIAFCEVTAEVDFRTLPEKLEVINLEGNQISGIAYLTDLPQHLRCLYIRNNPTEKVIVDNSSLPKSLERAYFDSTRGSLPIITVYGDCVDSRVGKGFQLLSTWFVREYEGW